MTTRHHSRHHSLAPAAALATLFLFSALFALLAHAQPAAQPQQTTTLTGRVFNTVSGLYLNNARVSVPGTNLTAQTDDSGTFLLARVPVTATAIEVFYTGFATKEVPVTLSTDNAAATTTLPDIEFTPADRRASTGKGPSVPAATDDDDIVQLQKFTVTARTMDGAAIAINEQRSAPNLTTVVSTDEYGIVPDGNVGEFLKMLPGITMSYRQGDPREVGINGVSSASVPISVGGFDLASSEISGSGRNVELNAISVNTLSRVEAVFSPTPETRGDALAGSINLVPRTAFEYRKPVFKATTYMYWRTNTPQWYRTPGPRQGSSFKARPGAEFMWVMPVTKNFGFTVSAGASTQYKETPQVTPTWRGNDTQTNPDSNFPDTPYGQPYMSAYSMNVQGSVNFRTSFATTADWRFTPNDVLSLGFTYGSFASQNTTRTLTYNLTNIAAGNFTTDRVTGTGQVNLSSGYNNRKTQTIMPTIRYRHKGAVWTTDMGIGWSNAQNIFRNANDGTFQTVNSRRGQVRITLDNIGRYRPETITVTDQTTGAPVDPYSFDNTYVLLNTAASQPTNTNDKITAFANAQRVFNWRVPLVAKVGLDYRSERKDNRTINQNWNFVGADGSASTAPGANVDDYAAPFQDTNYRQSSFLQGFPTVPSVDNIALYNFYQKSPDYFVRQYDNDYRTTVSYSKLAKETLPAAYIRLDTQLFDNRLKLTGGVRVERTDDRGWGPLVDPTGNYKYDAAGNIIRDPITGKPLPLYTDPLQVARATYIERGARTQAKYTTWFPSINASYTITQNLMARAAFYQTIGRPAFTQYSGGITLPDSDADPSTTYINVNNPNIKPWHANSYKMQLEYYFQKTGLLTIGGFARDYKDFFSTTTYKPDNNELLSYGLDPDVWGQFMFKTQGNVAGIVHTYGIDLNYRQALTFLPRWARGIQVSANYSWLFIYGAQANTNFSAFTPRSGNLSLSLTRPKFTARINLTYTSRTKQSLLGNMTFNPDGSPVYTPLRSVEFGTYQYAGERIYMDVRAEYSLTKKISLFASLSGVALTSETEDTLVIGPHTPSKVTLSSHGGNLGYYPLWTIGLKGQW